MILFKLIVAGIVNSQRRLVMKASNIKVENNRAVVSVLEVP